MDIEAEFEKHSEDADGGTGEYLEFKRIENKLSTRPDDRLPQYLFQHEETGRLMVAPKAPSDRWYFVSLRDAERNPQWTKCLMLSRQLAD